MEEVGFIEGEGLDLKRLLDRVKESSDVDKCGAIVVFNGIVRRRGHDGGSVKSLLYEADRDAALKGLKTIRKSILEKYGGVKEIFIFCFLGRRLPGEDTVYIVVLAEHRLEGFKACEEALNRLKKEVPVWKKEETTKGSYWVTEKGGKVFCFK